jgi:hypothetical protein
MNRRIFTTSLAAVPLAALLLQTGALAQGNDAAQRQKLVIQVSDSEPAKWGLALNNAKNVQEELGAANVDIEIVAYGPAIGMLRMDSPANSRITEAMKSGIKVVACQNTMRNLKLTKDDMHPAVGYVPAGVTEIMKLQRAGWSYIRP